MYYESFFYILGTLFSALVMAIVPKASRNVENLLASEVHTSLSIPMTYLGRL